MSISAMTLAVARRMNSEFLRLVRGIAGLAHVGLDKEILGNEAIAMPGRMIHPAAGAPVFQPYSHDPKDAINSVSRGGLTLPDSTRSPRQSSSESVSRQLPVPSPSPDSLKSSMPISSAC